MMMATVQDLMKAVGPAADLLIVNEYAEERTWHLAVSDGRQIFVELDESRGVLVISAPLVKAASSDRLRLYDLALRLNHAWEATGGLRLALEQEGGRFCLLLDVAVSVLDVEALGRRLRHFDARLQALDEMMATQPGDGGDLLFALSDAGTFRL